MALVTLTQGHLKLLELCPRRFQYTYLDQLVVSTDPGMLERQQWGTQFHQVMQQRELGLAVDPLLAQNPELEAAIQALLATAPDLFRPTFSEPELSATSVLPFRQSEHRRSMACNGYGLTVIYDLLIMTPTHAQIVDWKTYLHPPSVTQLAQDWQTRLYLYVLAETTDLAPEQLSMSYWFVQPRPSQATSQVPGQPSHINLPYSTQDHHRTDRDLRHLTDQLTALLTSGQNFPKVDEARGHCHRCPFAVRCQRTCDRVEGSVTLDLPTIEDIAEVPL